MSYREKQRFERSIDILNKLAILIYILVGVELVCYVFSLKIAFVDFGSISVKKYALVVFLTLALAFGIQQLAKRIQEYFIKKLKCMR